MGLTLAQLRALDAVVAERSFSGAAERLGISQPAVSGAMAALEREVGGAVVNRGDASPTPLGARLLPHARSAIGAVGDLRAVVDEFAGRPAGVVRLGVVTSVRHGLLPRLQERWSQELPGVRIEVLEGDDAELPEWLAGGIVEAAVLIDDGVTDSPDLTPRFDGLALPSDEMRAVVRTDHPLAGEDSVTLADLADDPLLCGTAGCEVQIGRLYRLSGLPLEVAHHVTGLPTLLSMVQAGAGVSIVPGYADAMLPPGTTMLRLEPTYRRRLTFAASPGARGPALERVTALAGALAAER